MLIPYIDYQQVIKVKFWAKKLSANRKRVLRRAEYAKNHRFDG